MAEKFCVAINQHYQHLLLPSPLTIVGLKAISHKMTSCTTLHNIKIVNAFQQCTQMTLGTLMT